MRNLGSLVGLQCRALPLLPLREWIVGWVKLMVGFFRSLRGLASCSFVHPWRLGMPDTSLRFGVGRCMFLLRWCKGFLLSREGWFGRERRIGAGWS